MGHDPWRCHPDPFRRADLLGALYTITDSDLTPLDDLSICELSRQMGLAQSTVSSLVERLERKQLVHRQSDPADRRFTRVCLSDEVRSYLGRSGQEKRLSPSSRAL
ncbi:MAG TPA: helix-turn-helix domain-containing protein [Anaerolineaceae bacterium]|jgi:DNA-binding MarR family transcriptional regulator